MAARVSWSVVSVAARAPTGTCRAGIGYDLDHNKLVQVDVPGEAAIIITHNPNNTGEFAYANAAGVW